MQFNRIIQDIMHYVKKDKINFIIWNCILLLMIGLLKFNFVSSIFGFLTIGILIPISLRNNKVLILTQLLLSMSILFFTLYCGINVIFKYLPDLISLIILIKVLLKVFKKEVKITDKYIVIFIILLIINIIAFIINDQSLIVFIVGLRNYYIFYISFLGYLYLDLTKNDVRVIIKSIIIFSFIQIPITVVQYFYFRTADVDLFQDYVAGTFGERMNGDLGFLILIVISLYISSYLVGKIKAKNLLPLILFGIPVILGEIKIVILILPVILVVLFLSRISKKGIKVLCFSIATIAIVFVGLIFKYPEFRNLFDVKYIEYYAYELNYGGYQTNRFSAPVYVQNNLLDTIPKELFGIGVGNGSDNGPEILNSKFFNENSTLGTNLFFSSIFLLENGWIGLSMFLVLMSFIIYKIFALKNKVKSQDDEIFVIASRGAIIVLLVSFLYSLSIFNLTFGYLLFFILAINIRISRIVNEEE